jgi:dihydroxy-acid dehydratase
LSLLVSAQELAARAAGSVQPPAEASLRGYRKLFLSTVTQADQGCDFDFLRGLPSGEVAPRRRD